VEIYVNQDLMLVIKRSRSRPADKAKYTPDISSETATWLNSSLSDVDYAAGLVAGFTGKPSDVFNEMFREIGGYFAIEWLDNQMAE
jgi:hypothetical protein